MVSKLYEQLNDLLKHGGAAFPFRADYDGGSIHWPGMQLRDYFAGQAMQGILAGEGSISQPLHEDSVAENAYAIADAMMKARERFADDKPLEVDERG